MPCKNIERMTPKIVNLKKLISDVSEGPKISLECMKVTHNTFSSCDTIFRETVRQILKKHSFFSKKCCKKSV